MPKKGYKQSPEHLERNRLARIGKKASEETKEKMRLAHSGEKNHNFGKKFSQETRDKISASRQGEKNPLYGTHRPEHVKKAIGDAHRGEKNKFFGKSLPEDVKEKIRAATSGEKNHNYGKPMPEYTKQKLAEQRIGKKIPEDVRIKMSEAQKGEKAKNYGVKFLESTCIKISESRMGEKNPQWKGGISSEPYCLKWTDPNLKIRKRVRSFFGNRCLLCGATKDQNNNMNMAVHHVTSNKSACCEGDSKEWLFATLCIKCHNTRGQKPETETILREIININYNGKCMHTLEEYNALFPGGSDLDMQFGKRRGF
jgi:hypothetical protein